MNIYQNYRFLQVLIYNLDHFFLIITCNLTISFNFARIKSFIRPCGNIPSIGFSSSFFLEMSREFIAETCFSVCFSKAFPKGEYVNLACSILFYYVAYL